MLSYFATVPMIIAVLLYILPSAKLLKAMAVAAQLALTCFAAYLFYLCNIGEVITRVGNFQGILGITLRADTLSSVFLILNSFIFLIVTVYCFNESRSRLYWFFLFIWEGLLSGVFLSCDLFNIFVLLEAATVVVSVLIMYNRDNRSMYDGMLYLMVNTMAMQFFLFGTGFIYKLTGALDMDAVAQAVPLLDKNALVLPFALIMTTVCLKCAMLPLFSWLPRAHGTPGAPTAVSAVLSGLHIKSGIYLFIRLRDVFQVVYTSDFFLVLGIITGIAGFLLALSQSDVKLVLAYSTISQVGMIMAGLNAPGAYSYTGSVYHIINHALFKSALFLCAGIIIDQYGTRDLHKIRGVLRRCPSVGIATIMAILGITGAPFFNGSISKYFIISGADWAVRAAMIFINLGTITVFIRYASMLFGRAEPGRAQVKQDRLKQAAVFGLGLCCFAGGIFGEQFIQFLFNVDVRVDVGGYLEKAAVFALSGLAGFAIYRFYLSKTHHLKRIKELELNFQWICVSLGLFFAATLLVTWAFL